MTGAAGKARLIVKDKTAVPVPLEFVALRFTGNVPVTPGIPEIKPVVVLTERPVGNPIALKLAGLLVAVMPYEKLEPTLPEALAPLVITGAGGGVDAVEPTANTRSSWSL